MPVLQVYQKGTHNTKGKAGLAMRKRFNLWHLLTIVLAIAFGVQTFNIIKLIKDIAKIQKAMLIMLDALVIMSKMIQGTIL